MKVAWSEKYKPWNYCKVCDLWMAPTPDFSLDGSSIGRRYHCNRCNTCCNELDHHCPWTNTCVGGNGWRSFGVYFVLLHGFMVFLLCALGTCLYCLWKLHNIKFTVGIGLVLVLVLDVVLVLPHIWDTQVKSEDFKVGTTLCHRLWIALFVLIMLLVIAAPVVLASTGLMDDAFNAVDYSDEIFYKRVVDHWTMELFTGLASLLLFICISFIKFFYPLLVTSHYVASAKRNGSKPGTKHAIVLYQRGFQYCDVKIKEAISTQMAKMAQKGNYYGNNHELYTAILKWKQQKNKDKLSGDWEAGSIQRTTSALGRMNKYVDEIFDGSGSESLNTNFDSAPCCSCWSCSKGGAKLSSEMDMEAQTEGKSEQV